MYRDVAQRNFARTLRNQPTDAEKNLWRHRGAEQLDGCKFRRQAAIGAFIVDFVCFSRKVIIELDGPQHLEPAAAVRDAERTNWLASRGFRVLRFRNQELDENMQVVLATIRDAVSADPSGITPP